MSFYQTAALRDRAPIPSLNEVDGTGIGTELLVSLINFVRPMVPSTQFQMPLRDLCTSAEGEMLLTSLNIFLALIVRPQVNDQPDVQSSDISPYYAPIISLPTPYSQYPWTPQSVTSGSLNTFSKAGIAPVTTFTSPMIQGLRPLSDRTSSLVAPLVDTMSVPRPLSDLNELPSYIKNKVYTKVFNDMPIRVITFNSKGEMLRLLERNAIASLIIFFMQSLYKNHSDDANSDDESYETSIYYLCRYAILSHTWIRGEPGDVLYQGWEERETPANAKGFSKIAHFCQVAAVEHNLLFGWMDTVCINKASSSELDESIRSMFKWYKSAHVCVTYLADTTAIEDMSSDSWFTRGWTLQELLAPRNIQFYNQSWKHLVPTDFFANTNHVDGHIPKAKMATRKKVSFRLDDNQMPLVIQRQIFDATTITKNELFAFRTSQIDIPLSRIMQLAARRTVTREEDKVYSLMGLLGVGIPVAYGEGSASAMQRFVREIMVSKTKFMDLFNHSSPTGIIPRDITAYMNALPFDGNARHASLDDITRPEPVLLTHLGIHLTLLAVPAFRRDTYEPRIPLESGRRVVLLPNLQNAAESYRYQLTEAEFILLDNSKYSLEWTKDLVTFTNRTKFVQDRSIVFLAILSSSVDSEKEECSLIASKALCIVMSSDKPGGSKFSDMRPVRQISGAVPVTLPYTWPDVIGPGEIVTITTEQANELGFKVVTYYFT